MSKIGTINKNISKSEIITIKKYNKGYGQAMVLRKEFNSLLFESIKKINIVIQQPKFQEYFYKKNIFQALSLNDLTNPKKYRKNVEVVKLDIDEKNRIIDELKNIWNDEIKLYDAYRMYRIKSKACKTYYSKHHKILKNNVKHPLGICISSNGEESTLKCLRELFDDYCLHYFYGHKFYFCRNNVSNMLEFDFYCIMIHDDRLVQFVIEIDGFQHQTGGFGKKEQYNDINLVHMRDVMKQYYLSQMNIHLLRINDLDNIKEQIENFINEIISTEKYVSINTIKYQEKYFVSRIKHDGLQLFYNYYKKKHMMLQDETGEETVSQYDPDCVIDDYVQNGVEYVVSKQDLDKFLNSDRCLRARK
jgi:hypothetical protein